MSAYQKEAESKRETSQMGLFDMGDIDSDQAYFELENVPPLSFEERMKGEKTILGYPVSGHPLDGIEAYIEKKSKNL